MVSDVVWKMIMGGGGVFYYCREVSDMVSDVCVCA